MLVLIVVKKVKPRKKIKKGEIRKALLLRRIEAVWRSSGYFIKFLDNSIVLIDKNYNPLASRLKGPVLREFRRKNFLKIVSMAPFVI